MHNILQWNINGISNNLHELRLLINRYNPNIIALQDTHLPFNSNFPLPNQYSGYFHNFQNNTSHKQGVGILVKKNIFHKQVSFMTDLSLVSIQIDHPFKHYIISIYIPPKQDISIKHFDFLLNISTPFILLGDFNAWNILWGSPKSNARGLIVENFLISSNLHLLNNGSPTHFSTFGSFSHIDLSFCSASIAHSCSWSILDDLHGSDHFPVLIHLNFSVTAPPKFKPNFIIDKADWVKFKEVCLSRNSTCSTSNNINQESARIIKIIKSAANISIPQTSSFPRKRSVPWWNKNLHTLRYEKQKAWHIFKKTRTSLFLIDFKKANAVFKKQAKEAKRKCFEDFANNISPSMPSKLIWTNIKKISGTSDFSKINFIKTSNGTTSAHNVIADLFVKHWSNLSSDSSFNPTFVHEKNISLTTVYNPNNICDFAKTIDKQISMLELNMALNSAKGKTPGFDKISYPMINNCPIILKSRILDLFNKIFTHNIIPQSWKSAIIIPIPKPNKPPTDLGSYRPISLLPCISKTLEKIVARRIMWYAQKKKLISPHQLAFKKKQSTTDSLILLDNSICSALSHKNHVTILSIDFVKAFDHIGMHAVLRQLNKWKVGKNIYSFVKGFLSSRKFRVSVGNNLSGSLPLSNGIPQGSPLSVVLFIIAFNEIANLLNEFKHIKYNLYADDLFIFTKVHQLQLVKNTFINILQSLTNWSQTAGPTISFTKSNILHICRKHNCNSFNLSFNNNYISSSNCLRILGIYFDNHYNFKQHILLLRKSLVRTLNIIKSLSTSRSCVHTSVLVRVTRAIMLSKIDYGLEVYGLRGKSHLKYLHRPYHSAIRRSLQAFPTTPINNLLAESGLPQITDRVQQKIYLLIPKVYFSPNANIFNTISNIYKLKRTPKIMSAIWTCFTFSTSVTPDIRPILIKPTLPTWLLDSHAFDLSMTKYQKGAYSNISLVKIFAEITSQRYTSWNILFTDGSKTSNLTSFAVTDANHVIAFGEISSFSSVFTAEAVAILNALTIAVERKGKYVICSDSLSVINSVVNPLSSYYDCVIGKIKDILIAHTEKLKLMWIPAHVGIKGNELTDSTAKCVYARPHILFEVHEKMDIQRFLKSKINVTSWGSYQHHYTRINPNRITPHFPSNMPMNKLRIFIRLRLGHTKITHEHLLMGLSLPTCSFCNSNPVSVDHLMSHCPAFSSFRTNHFHQTNFKSILASPSPENIITIYNFVLSCNIIFSI